MLDGQPTQAPCRRTSTTPSAAIPTSSTSPPSDCTAGRINEITFSTRLRRAEGSTAGAGIVTPHSRGATPAQSRIRSAGIRPAETPDSRWVAAPRPAAPARRRHPRSGSSRSRGTPCTDARSPTLPHPEEPPGPRSRSAPSLRGTGSPDPPAPHRHDATTDTRDSGSGAWFPTLGRGCWNDSAHTRNRPPRWAGLDQTCSSLVYGSRPGNAIRVVAERESSDVPGTKPAASRPYARGKRQTRSRDASGCDAL